jgi:hypothetical protein
MNKYEYVHFVHIEDKPKTSVWSCRMNRTDNELGQVKWYSPWRQYCYFPTVQAVYSAGCLKDIEDFIKKLMRLRDAPPPEEGK